MWALNRSRKQAVCKSNLVCILPLVYSLQSAFCILPPVCSLRFTLMGKNIQGYYTLNILMKYSLIIQGLLFTNFWLTRVFFYPFCGQRGGGMRGEQIAYDICTFFVHYFCGEQIKYLLKPKAEANNWSARKLEPLQRAFQSRAAV